MAITFNQIRSMAEWVCSKAKFVTINPTNLVNIIPHLKQVSSDPWFNSIPLKLDDTSFESALRFNVLFNTTSFCYWPKPRWRLNYEGQELGGAFSLTTCYAKEINSNQNLLSPYYWTTLDVNDYARITRVASNNELPLLKERVAFINAMGNFLLKNYDGIVENMLNACNYDANKVLTLLSDHIQSFCDTANYNGVIVPFYKRAQLMIADLSALCFEHKSKHLIGHQLLTACPDYKLPQIMRHYGLISYTDSLAQTIDSGEYLLAGSAEEVEIRAATIRVVDLLQAEILRTTQVSLAANQISDQIWLLSQNNIDGIKPYHHTITTNY